MKSSAMSSYAAQSWPAVCCRLRYRPAARQGSRANCLLYNPRPYPASKAAPAPPCGESDDRRGSHPGIVVRAMLRSQGREPGGSRIAGPVSVRPRGRTCRILQISGPLPDGACRETVAGGRRSAYDGLRNG